MKKFIFITSLALNLSTASAVTLEKHLSTAQSDQEIDKKTVGIITYCNKKIEDLLGEAQERDPHCIVKLLNEKRSMLISHNRQLTMKLDRMSNQDKINLDFPDFTLTGKEPSYKNFGFKLVVIDKMLKENENNIQILEDQARKALFDSKGYDDYNKYYLTDENKQRLNIVKLYNNILASVLKVSYRAKQLLSLDKEFVFSDLGVGLDEKEKIKATISIDDMKNQFKSEISNQSTKFSATIRELYQIDKNSSNPLISFFY